MPDKFRFENGKNVPVFGMFKPYEKEMYMPLTGLLVKVVKNA